MFLILFIHIVLTSDCSVCEPKNGVCIVKSYAVGTANNYPPSDPIRNTAFYKGHTQFGTKLNDFFDGRTFGIDLRGQDPCQRVSNEGYRKIIKNTFQCYGDLCHPSGVFGCPKKGSTDCYHVEHIIDENGPEFNECKGCKNIVANYVMANGRWNKGLGGLAGHNYGNSLNEKKLIYGTDIINRIRAKIQECMNRNKRDTSDDNDDCDKDGDCECDSDYECGCDCSGDEEDEIKKDKELEDNASHFSNTWISVVILFLSTCTLLISIALVMDRLRLLKKLVKKTTENKNDSKILIENIENIENI